VIEIIIGAVLGIITGHFIGNRVFKRRRTSVIVYDFSEWEDESTNISNKYRDMRRQLYYLMAAAFIAGLVCGGIINGTLNQPELVIHTVYVPVPVEVVKEVESVVIKTVPEPYIVTREVPVILTEVKEIPIEVRRFDSVEELEGWIESNHGLINTIHIEFNKHDDWNDCEDQADRWQKRALDDGYIVSACPVYNGMVFGQKIFETEYPYHVGLWTSVGNDYYYWDTVTGEITKLGVVRD